MARNKVIAPSGERFKSGAWPEALHEWTVEGVPRERVTELLEAASTHGAELVTRVEREFVRGIASALQREGVGRRWEERDVSSKQLAEHLFAVADGLHHLSATRAEYRARLRVAIRIVTKGA